MSRMVLVFLTLLLAVSAQASPICSPKSQGTALVVIDMQPYFITRYGHEKTASNVVRTERVLRAQIAAIRQARASSLPIIFLEYKDCGPTNSELKEAVTGYQYAKVIIKDTDGMFADSNSGRAELVDYLRANDIGTLLIAGANGGACVERSISGAMENGCRVIALTDAIADFNYSEFIHPYRNQYSSLASGCAACRLIEASLVQDSFEDNLPPHHPAAPSAPAAPPNGSH